MLPVVFSYSLSYLLGSVPFGLIISRLKGVDIRQHGSGNIGATNVFRVLGKPFGILCFALDFCKGLLGASLPLLLIDEPGASLPLISGALAIVGHNWPVWLKFKGGKGIATSGGVLAIVAPWSLLCALGTWILCMLATKIVSISSILAALVVGISAWFLHPEPIAVPIVLSCLGAIAIYRHRSNIQRLLNGEETGFRKGS